MTPQIGSSGDVTPSVESRFVSTAVGEAVASRTVRPGATLVIGYAGTGKSRLLNHLAQRAESRAILLNALEFTDLRTLGAEARRRFDGGGNVGDLLIVDGLDELRTPTTPEELAALASAPWIRDGHALFSMRSTHADAMQARSGRPDSMEWFPGAVFELRWSRSELLSALERLHSSRGAEATTLLLEPGFLDAEDGGTLRLDVLQRLIMATGDAPASPPLVVTTDGHGRLIASTSTVLPTSDLFVQAGEAPLRVRPWVIHRHSGSLFNPEAAELEQLINDPRITEHELQQFFERHPRLLTMGEYDRVEPHPVLVRRDGENLIPDFMLEPEGGFGDVLDLKRPRAPLVVGRANRLRPSAQLSEAIAQVREYGAFFEDASHREAFEKRYHMRAYKPRLIVVIGRDPAADPLALRRLWASIEGRTTIQTYDELLRRVRRLGRI